MPLELNSCKIYSTPGEATRIFDRLAKEFVCYLVFRLDHIWKANSKFFLEAAKENSDQRGLMSKRERSV